MSLTDRVLILNANWQAVTTTTVANAFVLLYRGAARAVSDESNDYKTYDFEGWIGYSAERPPSRDQVHTPTLRLEKPEILILTRFGGLVKGRIALNLRNIARRDDHTCMYCGRDIYYESKSIDHIYPRSRGGPTSWDNCVLACLRCNNRKRNRTPQEANLRLLTNPQRPDWMPFESIRPERFPKSWLKFLSPEKIR